MTPPPEVATARRPTMKDVAARAGVSVQTVSNLVNGRFGEMNGATRERVEAAMADLGYHPNSTARGLRSARTRTLGFLVLDQHERFLADPLTDLVMAGVGDVARSLGFGILIQSARPGEPEHELLAPAHERRIDGGFVILSGAPEVRRRYVDLLDALDLPFVIFDELLDDPARLSVRADEREGARRLTEHLLARGHTRIGFVAAAVPWAVVEQRHLGYLDALEHAGIRRVKRLERFEAGWEPGEVPAIVDALMGLSRPPTAIMCGSDLLAVATLHALRERGLRTPEDVAVSGFDDFMFAKYLVPPLTTVAVPAYEMGQAAAQMLIARLNGEAPAQQVVFPVELVLRTSA